MGKYIILGVALLLAVLIFPDNKLAGVIVGALGIGAVCLMLYCDNRTEDFKPVDCLKKLLKRRRKTDGDQD